MDTGKKTGLRALASALYIYSAIDAFAVNCVLYSIVCSFRKTKVTTISDHRSPKQLFVLSFHVCEKVI